MKHFVYTTFCYFRYEYLHIATKTIGGLVGAQDGKKLGLSWDHVFSIPTNPNRDVPNFCPLRLNSNQCIQEVTMSKVSCLHKERYNDNQTIKFSTKKSRYGRDQLSRPMRKVGPIKILRGCVLKKKKK